MTRQQKEQYALDLYQKGKTVREISQLTHMSFREIGAVTRAYKQEIERENGQLEKKDDIKSKSEITQAIKLF